MISRTYLSIQNLIFVTAFGFSLAGFQGFPVEIAAAAAAAASEAVGVEPQKVRIELYYESQCPYCVKLITSSFSEAFDKEGFLDMAEVTFVPYGNAHETKTYNNSDSNSNSNSGTTYDFECQHGPSECVYNIIEACALAKIDDPLLAFRYIDCIERGDESRDPKQDYDKIAIACCELTNLSDTTIARMETCFAGPEGIRLHHEAALTTEALDPPHKHVPYVVVNGEHSHDVQKAIKDSLFDYVCDAYLGPDKSPACPEETEIETTAVVTTSSLRATATILQFHVMIK